MDLPPEGARLQKGTPWFVFERPMCLAAGAQKNFFGDLDHLVQAPSPNLGPRLSDRDKRE